MNCRSVTLPAPAIIAGLCGALVVASAPAQAQEGRVINTIDIRGVKNTNRDIVRLALNAAGIREGQPFRADALPDARRLILDKGYYSDVFFNQETVDNKVNLIVEVAENPLITQVVVRGNRTIPSDKILPFLDSKPGTVVNTNTLREDAQKIQRIYRQAGYEAFLSELEEVFDTKTGILTFPVTETIVESIEVEGLNKTQRFVVTREMQTEVGKPYNLRVLEADLTRIANTGLFENVLPARSEPVAEGRVKVVVPVVEQRTGQVQFGVGYSVQQRLTGTVAITEQNFRGRGQGLIASWTVGGTVARNQIELGFSEPWLDKNNTSLSVNLYSRFNFRFGRQFTSTLTGGNQDNLYFEQRQGGQITVSRPIRKFSRNRVFTSLRSENIRANNLTPDWNQLTNDEINSIRGALVRNGRVNAVTVSFQNDSRDYVLDPTTGWFFSPSVEVGNADFFSTRPRVNPDFISDAVTPNVPRVLVDDIEQRGAFTRMSMDARRYINLDRTPRTSLRDGRKVLATRLLIGRAQGSIGFSEQFFIGGADDLRGHADQRFWGNNMFLFSNELRLPFAGRNDLVGVVFVDIGDAWGATDLNAQQIPGFEQHKGFSPRVGAGVGIRFKTPVGPVRLDLGFGQVTRTHFAIGQSF
jgi:outer membrane protein insertion porin family